MFVKKKDLLHESDYNVTDEEVKKSIPKSRICANHKIA